jgi:hypothetical protein
MMMTPTFATLFSGGGGADIGARHAGYAPLWAVEDDAAIAAWHTRNLPDTQMIVARVQDVDYRALPRVDWLLLSRCSNVLKSTLRSRLKFLLPPAQRSQPNGLHAVHRRVLRPDVATTGDGQFLGTAKPQSFVSNIPGCIDVSI